MTSSSSEEGDFVSEESATAWIVRQKLGLWRPWCTSASSSCIERSSQPIHGDSVQAPLSRRRNDDCPQGLVLTPSNTSAVMGCFCHQNHHHHHHHHRRADRTPKPTSHSASSNPPRPDTTSGRCRKLKSFSFLLVLQLILVLFANYGQTTLTQEGPAECFANRCGNNYFKANPKSSSTPRLPAEPTPAEIEAYFQQLKQPCKAVQTLRRCLKKIRLPCMFDLYYQQYKRIMETENKKYQCRDRRRYVNMQRKTYEKYNSTLALNTSTSPVTTTTTVPPTTPTTTTTATTTSTVVSTVATLADKCVYKAAAPNDKYSHCAMFGDPHLRTFSDRFYTCSIAGTWQLIDNRHLVVMATNVEVLPGSEATITSKITVLIKNDDDCADYRTYVATTEHGLPGAFKDGSTVSKRGGISIVEVVPDAHVEITIPYINTLIVIRNVGNYLTFAARMPQQLVESLQSTDQLCVTGCQPTSQVGATSGNQFQPGHRYQAPPTPKPVVLFDEKGARLQCRVALLRRLGYLSPMEEIASDVAVIEEPSADRDDGDSSDAAAAAATAASEGFIYPNDPSSWSFKLLHTSEDERERKRKNPRSRKRHAKHRRGKRTRRPVKRDLENLPADAAAAAPPPPCIGGKSDSSYNFYFESCVFDLMTTGDANLTLAAAAALEDVRMLHELGENAPGASVDVIQRWPAVRICPSTEPVEKDGTKPAQDQVERSGPAPGSGVSKRSQAASAWLVLLCTLTSFLLCAAQIDSTRTSSPPPPTDLNIAYDVTKNGVTRTFTSHRPSLIECT